MAKTQPTVKKAKTKKKKKILLPIISSIGIIFLIALFFFFQYVVEGLPTFEELENPKQMLASDVFSADGELIGRFFRENRMETSIDSIPQFVVDALIATEDRKFFDHWGVDLDRVWKAITKTIFLGKRQGGSTITQQLAKNIYGFKAGRESSFDVGVRKFREWFTSVQLEKSYTKNEILEMYFNISYFGEGAYGIGTASKVYFNKPISKLKLEEASVLIAMLRSWKYYHPVRAYNSSLARRNLVMYNMVDAGFLSRAVYDSLKALPIQVSMETIKDGFVSDKAPHFVEYVRQQLEDMSEKYDFDLYEDGLTIYTTIDLRMQKIAVEAAQEHLDKFQKETFDPRWNWNRHRDILDEHLTKAIRENSAYRKAETPEQKMEISLRLKKNVAFVDSVQRVAQRMETAFVCLDVKNGNILAMIGGRDQSVKHGLNRATQVKRQPGSSFKPIVYTCAIDNGLYPAYPILNQRFLYDDGYNQWSPENFDLSTSNFETLREGLRRSLNLVAARLVIEGHVPLSQIGRYAEKMGINTRLTTLPSISLGASEVIPLEMVTVYATLANHGIYNTPISILKIEDKDGIIIDNFYSTTREAISEATAYIMTDMLKTSIDRGTGAAARSVYNFHRPAAGKTGTASEYKDTWFMGYTPQIAAGVWVGFDDHKIAFTGQYGTGSRVALPIWAKFMQRVYEELEEELPLEDFEMPENGEVVTATFCSKTIFENGDPKLWSSSCDGEKYSDILLAKDLPRRYDPEKDTLVKIFDRYQIVDSLAHEAVEIIEE